MHIELPFKLSKRVGAAEGLCNVHNKTTFSKILLQFYDNFRENKIVFAKMLSIFLNFVAVINVLSLWP